MPGIQSSSELQNAYEELLRGAGRGDLLESEESPDFESTVLRVLAQGRASEARDATGHGLLEKRTDEELLWLLRDRVKGANSLAFPIQLAYREVLSAAEEYNYSVPFPVLVGVFPTGSFNAQAILVDKGALLLINSGLMMFLHQTAQLMCKSFTFIVKDDNSDAETRAEAHLTHDGMVRELTHLVLIYLMTRSSTTYSQSDMQTGVHGMVASMLTKGAECFVIGHELGHALAGHLKGSKGVLRATGLAGIELPFVPKSWEEEIEADLYGMRLLTPPSKRTMRTAAELQFFMCKR